MDCEHVREEFVERLTGTLDAGRSKAIDDHIAGCAACRAETDRLRELWTELGALNVPAAAGGARRIERMIDARSHAGASPATAEAPTARRDGAPRFALSAVALAASLAIGVVLGQRWNGARDAVDARDPGTAASTIAVAQPAKEKYVLLLHGPERPAARSPEQAAADSASERALVAEYGAWAGQLAAAGVLVAGEKLADYPLTILAANSAAQPPRFTADELGGFFIIQAADSAEAYRIARECPHLKHGGTVQVRRIEPT